MGEQGLSGGSVQQSPASLVCFCACMLRNACCGMHAAEDGRNGGPADTSDPWLTQVPWHGLGLQHGRN